MSISSPDGSRSNDTILAGLVAARVQVRPHVVDAVGAVRLRVAPRAAHAAHEAEARAPRARRAGAVAAHVDSLALVAAARVTGPPRRGLRASAGRAAVGAVAAGVEFGPSLAHFYGLAVIFGLWGGRGIW